MNKLILIIFILFLFNPFYLVHAIELNNNNYFLKNEEYKNYIFKSNFFEIINDNGIFWFLTPNNGKFYSNGVLGVEPSLFFYGNYTHWINQTRDNLKTWGFNTITGSRELNFPYILRFRFKHLSATHGCGWYDYRIPDVFDKWWQDEVNNATKKFAKPLINDSKLIGFYTDNEMKWGPDEADQQTLLEVYMAAENNTSGKKRLIDFFKDQYNNNVSLFNEIWLMNITNFTDLNNYKKLGFENIWYLKSKINILNFTLKSDFPYRKNEKYFIQAKQDVENFSRLVANTYFNITNSALKKYDPNHLNLGVRFHLYGVPQEVLEECGKFVDVISINYYRFNKFFYDPLIHITSLKYGCIPLNNWMYKYYKITKKPIIISEYRFIGRDNIWPIKLINKEMLNARTQIGRGSLYKWYVLNCYRKPYIIGQHWFVFRDTLDSNCGIVNLWDEPYLPLIKIAAMVNSRSINVHAKSSIFSQKISEIEKNYEYINHSATTINYSIIKKDKLFEDEFLLNNFTRVNINQKNKSDLLFVGGKGYNKYKSIQDAIDNASDGDTVYVFEGLYNEKIFINKSIFLIGQNKNTTIISGFYEDRVFTHEEISSNNVVITINSDNVLITGFLITSSGVYIDSSNNFRACLGIIIKNYNNINISGNIFYGLGGWGNGGGIIALKCNKSIIENNLFNGIKGSSVIIDGTTNIIIKNNFFNQSLKYGIWISTCKNIIIKKNNLIKCTIGLTVKRSLNNIVTSNNIEGSNKTGLYLEDVNNNIISYNNFIDNFESVNFLNSFNNKWNKNYWDRFRILPIVISGKMGAEGFIPLYNFDLNPAKRPYNIPIPK